MTINSLLPTVGSANAPNAKERAITLAPSTTHLPGLSALLGARAFTALKVTLAACKTWWWLPIRGAAHFAFLATVYLLTVIAPVTAVEVTLKTLDGSLTARLPRLAAPRSFAHVPDSVPNKVIDAIQPFVAGSAAIVKAALLIIRAAALNALAISALKAFVAACEVRRGEPVGIAALFALLTTVNRLALVIGGAAVSILVEALNLAITTNSTRLTTAIRLKTHQPGNVGYNVGGTRQPGITLFSLAAVLIPFAANIRLRLCDQKICSAYNGEQ